MTFHSYHDDHNLYFVTATICGWKRLFENPTYAQIVLDSLKWLRDNNRMFLFAYVLMPSHLHAILKPRDRKIGEVLQNFGSYTAHELLRQMKQDNQYNLLAFFHSKRRDERHQHSIWQDIQAKNIFTKPFLEEKLEYIHNNPVKDICQVSSDPAEYRYSSACFYDHGEMPVVMVDDVREWV